jgi:acyl-CoA thioester hydrolase
VAAFSANVAVRWSDMDVYGHVNNARVVTLLEEARTQLLFELGARHGAGALADGLVVVELQVQYRRPVEYSADPVQIRLWVSELRAAWFTLDYVVLGEGPDPAVTARIKLAPYETETKRPRRLSRAERDFLEDFRVPGGFSADGAAADTTVAAAAGDGRAGLDGGSGA